MKPLTEGVQLQKTQVASIPHVSESHEELSQEAALSLQQQIENTRLALLSRSEGPIYSVDELGLFWEQNESPAVFKALMAMMTPVKKRKHKKDAQQHV